MSKKIDCGCGHCTFDADRKLWIDGYVRNWALSPEYCQQCGRWLGVDFETGKPIVGPPGREPEVDEEEEVPLHERYTDWLEWTRAWQKVEKERPSLSGAAAWAAWMKRRRWIILRRPLTEQEKKENEKAKEATEWNAQQ